MALHDLADPAAPLPSQPVLDSSLLLVLRRGDDNPQATFADLASFDEILASIPLTPVQPQDALILAEAGRLGVRAVAILDGDWRRVTEFDIYSIPLTSVPLCDNKRLYSPGRRGQVTLKQGIALTYPWIKTQVRIARKAQVRKPSTRGVKIYSVSDLH